MKRAVAPTSFLLLLIALVAVIAGSFPKSVNGTQWSQPNGQPSVNDDQIRPYTGWVKSNEAGSQRQDQDVRTSYFQAPGGQIVLPPLPQQFPPQSSGQVLPEPTRPVPQASNVFPEPYANQRMMPASNASYPQTIQSDNAGLRVRSVTNPTQGNANGTMAQLRDAGQVTSGLPFVTPAPGRYPTSPYMGPRGMPTYQNVGYQRAAPGAYTMQSAGINVAQLPQYQTTPNQNPIFSANPPAGTYQTSAQQCQVLPPPSLPPDGAAGQTYVPPTLPPNWNPNLYAQNNLGYRPLFTLGQENNNVVLGRGLIGQPKAYVPGQCIRNFFRYLTP